MKLKYKDTVKWEVHTHNFQTISPYFLYTFISDLNQLPFPFDTLIFSKAEWEYLKLSTIYTMIDFDQCTFHGNKLEIE